MAAGKELDCLFVSLGMLVLDEIHFPGQEPRTDVIGGSGAYCSLGARVFISPPESRRLGWLIRTGDDFPNFVKEIFDNWGTLLLESRVKGQLSTRGELIYEDSTFGPKKFRYITKPLTIEPKHLLHTPLLAPRHFHFLGGPKDTRCQIRELINLRQSIGIEELPTIIWEPAPPSCLPQILHALFETIKAVDVLSPNHIELAAFFGIGLTYQGDVDRSIIERLALKCLASGIGIHKQGTVIVRAGREGCCVWSRQKEQFVWLPPFYHDSPKVVDPTGAGNAFLGGFAIGIIETGNDVMAACYGTVASTFALEQIGLPTLGSSSGPAVSGERNYPETWNGSSVRDRLDDYISSLGKKVDKTLLSNVGLYGQL